MSTGSVPAEVDGCDAEMTALEDDDVLDDDTDTLFFKEGRGEGHGHGLAQASLAWEFGEAAWVVSVLHGVWDAQVPRFWAVLQVNVSEDALLHDLVLLGLVSLHYPTVAVGWILTIQD